jgi:hypothetical protein
LAFAPTKASATPILWTLNATQNSGGTVAGSFVYDADTNVYSSVAIVTTVPNASFDTSEIGGLRLGTPSASALHLQLIDGFVPGANTGKPTIAMSFSGGLTNAGGVVSLGLSSEDGVCANADCGTIFAILSSSTVGGSISGQLTGTPVASAVPEPATLVLCSAGFVGAGVRRWRQRRA